MKAVVLRNLAIGNHPRTDVLVRGRWLHDRERCPRRRHARSRSHKDEFQRRLGPGIGIDGSARLLQGASCVRASRCFIDD